MRLKDTRKTTAALAAATVAVFAGSSFASIWAGGGGNWSSNGSPGWNGTGVPNGVGHVAQFGAGSNATLTLDVVPGITLGTITQAGSSNSNFQITLGSNTITMDQDGAGAGTATISNSNTNTSNPGTVINAGTLTLADDLLISNTGGSTRTSGSVAIAANIGGTGNITISNVSNNTGAGQIILTGGTSDFTGTVSVNKGALTFNDKDVFGNKAANTLTIGSASGGNTTVISTSATGIVPNNIVVASGSNGTLVLGSTSTATTDTNFGGTVLLSGDLHLTSLSAGAGRVTLSNTVSGGGSLTKIGSGASTISGTNNYSGGTRHTNGLLQVNTSSALGSGAVAIAPNSGATLQLNSALTIASLATSDGIAPPTIVGGTGYTNGQQALVITGGGGTGAAGIATIAGGVITSVLITNYGTGYTSAPTFALTTPGAGTGGSLTGVFAASAVNLQANTLTIGGANASPVTYAGAISGTGGLIKNGNGVQILSGTNGYSGTTTVNGGSLLVNGSLTGSTNAISVTAGTLGGTGSITGAVTIGNNAGSADSILSPGASVETLDTGSLTFGSDGVYLAEVDGLIADRTNVIGTVTLAGNTLGTATPLDVQILNNAPVEGTLYFLINNDDGSDPVSGLFKNGSTLLNQGDTFDVTFNAATYRFQISYAGQFGDTFSVEGGNDVVLQSVAVPEPAAVAIAGLAGVALLRRRRR